MNEKKLKVPHHLIEKSSDLLQEIALCIALAKRKEGENKTKRSHENEKTK